MKMNPEFKALWVEALRSGKYKQGKGKLRQGDEHDGFSYCCLGVVTDLVRPNDWVRSKENSKFGILNDAFTPSSVFDPPGIEFFDLPADVAATIGFDKTALFDGEWTVEAHLQLKNDGLRPTRHLTFAEIADWIEEHL